MGSPTPINFFQLAVVTITILLAAGHWKIGVDVVTADSFVFNKLAASEFEEVLSWGLEELEMMQREVCWRDSYGNGIGKALTCAKGLSKEGALCYTPCTGEYDNTPAALFCRKKCPSGFHDDGLFCRKPSAYGRGVGHSCLHGRIFHRHCSCHHDEDRRGLMCYKKCREGYHPFGCCLCSPSCPSGWNDIGVSCKKPKFARAIKPLSVCPDGLVQHGLLCYEPCREGFHGIGPVCWGGCPVDQPHNCAGLCTKDKKSCAVATLEMVVGPLEIVANVFTYGAASKAHVAAETLTKTMTFTEKSIKRLHETFDLGTKFQKAAVLADKEVANVLDAIEDGVIHGPLFSILLDSYGNDNAISVGREIAISLVIRIILESLKEFGLTGAELIDPTGILVTIMAFKQPKCRLRHDPPFFPGIKVRQEGNQSNTRAQHSQLQPNIITSSHPHVHVLTNQNNSINTNNTANSTTTTSPPTATPIGCNLTDVKIPPCLFGLAILNTTTCEYTCPSQTCANDTAPLNCDALGLGCASFNQTCDQQQGYQCVISNHCNCSTTCAFNPALCTTDPCESDEAKFGCVPGTCQTDLTVGCNYNCTLQSSDFCTPHKDPPACPANAPIWIVNKFGTNCSWGCNDTCPDGQLIRSCIDNNGVNVGCNGIDPIATAAGFNRTHAETCELRGNGWECVNDYCASNEFCQPTCRFNPSIACDIEPCSSQAALETCMPNTCVNNYTAGCSYSCDPQPRTSLVMKLTMSLEWTPITAPANDFRAISLEIEHEMRVYAYQAGVLNATMLWDNTAWLHRINETGNPNVWLLTICFRGMSDEDRTDAMLQFFDYLNQTEGNSKIPFSLIIPETPVNNSYDIDTTVGTMDNSIVTGQTILKVQTCDSGVNIPSTDTCPFQITTNTSPNNTNPTTPPNQPISSSSTSFVSILTILGSVVVNVIATVLV